MTDFKPKITIVILYTELADYLLSCVSELSDQQINVHIVHYPVNKEAPFKFDSIQYKATFYNRTTFNKKKLISLVENLNPSLIYCAGWNDKDYLDIVTHFKSKIPALLGFDNQWNGSLKQYLSTIYARIFITPHFKYAFVPGYLQKKFALKLGFRNDSIFTGAYSANIKKFEENYLDQKEYKQVQFPHKFIYVGRYVNVKGLPELWQAFIELQNEQENDWELWCLGVGDLEPVKHPKIKHFGFVQPKDMLYYTSQTGVFILPSRFEPWGVVVHEFAACGFPLLLSDKVGAKESFLQEAKNGFEFKSGSVTEIKKSLKNIIHTSESKLIEMGKYSNELSKTITPQKWVSSLLKMAETT